MFREILKHKAVKSLSEWLLALGIALAVYFLLQAFVVKAIGVTGISMEPTFEHGDRVLVNLLAYRFSEPAVNDVIAFSYQIDPTQKFIKRIIGQPGDTIDMIDYQFSVNGERVDDAFSGEIVSSLGDEVFPLVVPDGRYFVLGDNRNASKDSRYSSVGCVPKEDVIGKVALRIWPLKKIGAVH